MPKLTGTKASHIAFMQGYEMGLAHGRAGNGEHYFDDPRLMSPPSVYAGQEYFAPKKGKRKPSAYSKRYGTAYKRLKKKHPRMSFGSLSKKAHKEARR